MPRQKKQHLKRRPDGRYACRYQSQWFYGDTEDEALSAREYYKQQQKSGAAQQAAPLTVADFALPWLPREKSSVSYSTYRSAARHLEILLQHIGSMLIRDVKPSHIKSVYATSFSGLSDYYIKSAARLYKSLFDAAMGDGHCSSNPARDKSASPPKGTSGSHRPITDLERLWITTLCTSHRCHAAVMTMLYAGLRPQEAKALNLNTDYDPVTQSLTVSHSVHLSGTNSYTVSSRLKTSASARTIPVLSPLRKALQGRHGLLVTSAAGKPITISSWKSLWNSYVTAMETAINGCEERWWGKTKEHKAILASGGTIPPFQHFTVVPYDLRHSFCVMCRDSGVDIKTCITWMGHSDVSMILKVYDAVTSKRSLSEIAKLEKSLVS